MSENNVNGIIGADVATTTGIVGATIAIGQYIVNDYVITITEAEGDYGYTMTITKGTQTQTVTLYGLTPAQYDAMLGYLEQAQAAAQSAQSAAESAGESETAAREFERVAGISASSASSAKTAAQSAASNARSAASDAASAKNDAVTAKNAAEAAATRAEAAAGQITGMTAEAETLEPGSSATASFLDGVLSLGIPAGAPGADGDDGNGIVSIVKTGTSGNVDTYTITYTNGTTSAFTVTNGVDGAVTSVAGKTGAVTLNAGDVAFDDQQTYDDGTVGAGLTNLKSQITQDIYYGANQLFSNLSSWVNGYLNAYGEFVTANNIITPMSAPIKLGGNDKVVVNCGSLVCGLGYFRYDADTQEYTRHYSVDKTGVFEIISDCDNFYFALTFKKNPQTAITPDEFDGYIGKYTDWRLKIDKNTTKLSADGMVEVFTDLAQWTAGYFNSSGIILSSGYRCTPLTSPFLFYSGDTIEIDPGNYNCNVATYNYNSGSYTRKTNNAITEKTIITFDTDQYISFDFGNSPAGQSPATDFTGYIKYSVPWKTKIYSNSSRITVLETASASGNYLAGKKLVACGDSITAAVNPQGGNFDSYARLAAQRNGMVFDLNAVSGSTMTNVEGKSPFCVNRYQQVPSDFDYLTIWFGFNDGAYAQVGTINDTEDTTFYGAYKKVLDYYLTTYPTKKIGLVVPYMSNGDFQDAVRNLSKMYGVPCLDLPDYNQCSIVWGSANTAQTARKNALTYDGTHPNQTGHEFISSMYEAFLRRL